MGGDPIRGIFGDEHVLVVLAPDHLAYTAYNTSTGEEIRQGRLDNESRQTSDRRTFGRCLMYITAEEANRRLRILGFAERSAALRSGNFRSPACEGDVRRRGCRRLRRLHAANRRCSNGCGPRDTKLETPRKVQNACQLAIFRDASRYYVNLQPVQSPPEPRFYNYFFGTDTVLPRVDVRGDVLAIDRKTGRLVWKRGFQQRTILRTPSLQLPVLVMLSSSGRPDER